MSRTVETSIFCAVAVVILGSALLLQYQSAPAELSEYELVSQPFYPDFNDPIAVTSLEVVDFDEDELRIREFAVERNKQGRWVIPSHHGYPAEAKERLERAASSVIGVVREASQSRRKDDWARLGVQSPTEFDEENLEGYGQKITFKDEDGEVLVDLIVGKPVPDQSGYFYVRRADETATYIAKLNLDLSAKFQDWIKPELLGINSAFDLVSIGINKYSLNEQRRTIVPGTELHLTRNKTTDPWLLEGINEETEELNTGPISSFGNKVADLRIVGVRPKPRGINPDLTVTPEMLLNQQVLEIDMGRRGFLIAATQEDETPRLFSNEGEVSVGTKDGVDFTLYLGEIVSGSDEDIEIGAADETKPGDDATEEPTDTPDTEQTEKGPRRYVLVTAEFNESLLGPKPVEPVAPVMPEELKQPTEPESGNDAKPVPDASKEKNDADASAADPDGAAPANDPSPEADAAKTKPDAPDAEGSTGESTEESAEPPSNDVPSESDESSCYDETTSVPQESTLKVPASEEPADAPQESDETSPAAEDAPQETTTNADETAKPAAATETDQDEKTAEPDGNETPQTAAEDAESKPDEPAPPKIDSRAVLQAAYDEQLRQYEAAKRAYETDIAEFNRKAEEGKEKAGELSDRFAAWYYVITADSFDELNLKREDIVKSKVAAQDDAKEDTP